MSIISKINDNYLGNFNKQCLDNGLSIRRDVKVGDIIEVSYLYYKRANNEVGINLELKNIRHFSGVVIVKRGGNNNINQFIVVWNVKGNSGAELRIFLNYSKIKEIKILKRGSSKRRWNKNYNFWTSMRVL